MGVPILPMGDRALLAEPGDLDAVLALHAALAANRPPGVVDLVPAARTVLVRIDPAVLPLPAAERWIADATPLPSADRPAAEVRIPVRYDGPDLAATAELLGLTPADLIARHTGTQWTAGFLGFGPGFAYLVSDVDLAVPRLPTSRPRVPAGSVALAGPYSAVYPRESPGGWRLIGSTDAALWDEVRDPPALLPPGTRVRFEAIP
ncbi:MAG TPA: allophanate hydrolase subunit 1 [Naasia sp.]|jgi:KipI family sensor histidine kinase inhibitor